jgi:DeoR/GlpR family transcriptional regulator of sugar metabolism
LPPPLAVRCPLSEEAQVTIGARSVVLQRRLKIAEWIRQNGQMRVDELSQSLMVSEVTIRGDLSYLEDQGLIVRSFGRAIAAKTIKPRDQPTSPGITKATLGPMLRLAQSLIEPDQTVLIGPGEMPAQFIPLLAEISGLAVVLSALDAVPLAQKCLDGRLHLLGGEIGLDAVSLEGAQAIRGLDYYPLGACVFQSEAVSAGGMMLLATKPMARFCAAAATRAARSIVLVEHPSLSLEQRPAQLALGTVTDLIVPSNPSARTLELLSEAGFAMAQAEGLAMHFARRMDAAS